MTPAGTDAAPVRLVLRGLGLEYATLSWNVTGVAVLAVAALAARSVALAGCGLDSLIEIGASAVVIWELRDTGKTRRRAALRRIAIAFAVLALYLAVQSTWVIAAGFRARHSPAGILDGADRRSDVRARLRKDAHRDGSGQPGPDDRGPGDAD